MKLAFEFPKIKTQDLDLAPFGKRGKPQNRLSHPVVKIFASLPVAKIVYRQKRLKGIFLLLACCFVRISSYSANNPNISYFSKTSV